MEYLGDYDKDSIVDKKLNLSITFTVDTEQELLDVLSKMQAQIAGFVLDGKTVHIDSWAAEDE